jgi:putative thioredoxin
MTTQKPQMQNGVIDLSTLGAKPAPTTKTESVFIIDVTEENFESEVLLKSKQVPVVVAIGSKKDLPSSQVFTMLEKLTIEYAGKIFLARVDSDANPQIVAAFQTQTLPSVYLLLNGQVQPLFNEVPAEAQVRGIFDQVVEVAAKADLGGVNAGIDPENPTGEMVDSEKPIDPRFVKAFDAMEAGDWDAAEAVYRDVLNNAPADEEAKVGVIQVGLFRRTDGVDFNAVIGKSLDNLEAHLEVADSLMMLGQVVPAFDLLIAGVKIFVADEREQIKQRLLDYFLLIGEVDEVRSARRQLTNALF